VWASVGCGSTPAGRRNAQVTLDFLRNKFWRSAPRRSHLLKFEGKNWRLKEAANRIAKHASAD